MLEIAEKRNKLKAFVGTIAVHTILLFLFIWIAFKTPLPPFPESGSSGIEINFGDLNEGTGNVEETGMGDNNTPENKENIDLQQNLQSDNDAVVTNNVENTITINKNENSTKVDIKKSVEPTPSMELLNALNALKNNKSNASSGGDGNSGKSGNEGDPNGSKNSDGNGGNGGTGNKYDLKGRIMLKTPEIVNDSQDEGNVVVEIIVDEIGKIIKATPGARGSTTTSAILYAKARQAALSAKFNASPNGIAEQRGTITFVFLLN